MRVNVNSAGGIEVIRASGRDGGERFRGRYGGSYADDERVVEGLPGSSEAFEAEGEVQRRWTWHGAINHAGFVSARGRDDRGSVVRFGFELHIPDYTATTSKLLEQERQRFANIEVHRGNT